MDNKKLSELDVITWGSPIICFGNIYESEIATLGINPSNREFVDSNGSELTDENRRFHTLNSLGINTWRKHNEKHISQITESCIEYFNRNPYDNWFKKLDYLISGTGSSYYFPYDNACHLDLIPYATTSKWSELSAIQKSELLNICINTLGNIISKSSINFLVLNGKTVIENLEKSTQIKLIREEQPEWTLKRNNGTEVKGYSYTGYINKIANINLEYNLLVLGYNHKIQSSFGITSEVTLSIRNWITNFITNEKKRQRII